MTQMNETNEPAVLNPRANEQVSMGVLFTRVLLIGLAALGVAFNYGFYHMGDLKLPTDHIIIDGWLWLIHISQGLLLALFLLDYWGGYYWYHRVSMDDHSPRKFDLTLHVLAAVGFVAGILGFQPAWHLFEIMIVCLTLEMLWHLNVGLSRKLHNPGLLLPLSFGGMVLIGGPLLKLPLAIPPGAAELSWIDAFFTATSAACITGLAVRDTASQFTPFGQTIIIVLVQLGGLGMIIFGSMLAVLLGSRPSLRENLSLSQMLDNQPLVHVKQMVRFIVVATLLIELVGAAATYPFWDGDLTVHHRIGLSIFHAASAFCNAGFALYPNSLEGYRYSLMTHMILAPLIVIGGMGYPVLNNIWVMIWTRVQLLWRRPARFKGQYNRPLTYSRLTLHTKIVLTATACLYIYGMLVVFSSQLMPYISEATGRNVTANAVELKPLTVSRIGAMVADSSFMSITSRTAGFNAMPMEEIGPAGHVATMTLMFVGGSPGGTTGGIKVTTMALMILSVWATVCQRQESEAFGRRIYDSVIRRATAIVGAMMLMITLGVILLCLSEPFPFMKLLFEAVSAATTTGLSLGITGGLSAFGKSVIIGLMFLGRVGPLALLGALIFTGKSGRPYTLAHEDVMLG